MWRERTGGRWGKRGRGIGEVEGEMGKDGEIGEVGKKGDMKGGKGG